MEIANLKVLVTGGAGFIGSHLVDALLERGNIVTVMDDLSSGSAENLKEHLANSKIRLIRADIRNRKSLEAPVKEADVVFHLAAQCLRLSIGEPLLVHEVNATGTLNLCLAARDAQVKRFLYVSSSAVYGSALKLPMGEDHPLKPTTPYGASKLAGEACAMAFHKTYGLPVIAVRPFNTYGPRSHFHGPYGEVIPRFVIRVSAGLPPIIFGDGQQTRDFTEVSDTVRGIILASECDALLGDVVNISSGEEVRIEDLAEVMIEKLNPHNDLRPAHWPPRPGEVQRRQADASKAQRLLKFSCKYDLAAGIERYVRWLQTENIDPGTLAKQEAIRNW